MKHYGPYSEYEDAERLAVEAARKLGSHGERAHVCVMGDDGKIPSEMEPWPRPGQRPRKFAS
jgi:hypothetical protein